MEGESTTTTTTTTKTTTKTTTAGLRLCMDASAMEAGIDEAGRGCLAGPVVAAAVVWNPELDDHPMLALVRDSKRLSPGQRAKARAFIEENAIAYAVRFVDAPRIDGVNILRATFEAMHGAVDDLGLEVDALLVDGDRFPVYVSGGTGEFVPHTLVIEGDDKFVSIAAASVLAKTHRDEYVATVMHAAHPEYGWDRNKGYGSAEHMDALRRLGPTPFHRLTFGGVLGPRVGSSAKP